MKKFSTVITKPIILVLSLLFLIYIMVGFFGYGNDNDTYYMLNTGRNMWLNGSYQYSRPPGYFIPEMIIGGASLIGGYLLTNLLTAILGTATLFIFWQLLKKVFSDSDALLIVLIVGFNPYFIIASSSTMDYVYSLFFCMAGIKLLTKRSIFFAAVLFALAASSRMSSVLAIGIIYLYYFHIRYKENDFKEMTRLFLSGCLLSLLTILLYLPSYIAEDYTFRFFTYYIPDWSFVGHLSRFIYKNIYLVGMWPFVLISTMTTLKMYRLHLTFRREVNAGLAILLAFEILFLKIPVEISYLIPVLFVVIPLFVFFCRPSKIAMYILIALTFSYSFLIYPDFIEVKYNKPIENNTIVKAKLFISRGVIINDVLKREQSERTYWQEIVLQNIQIGK